MTVSTKSVSEIIGRLECGKPAGPDGICAVFKILKYQDTCVVVNVLYIMSSSWLLTTSYD